MMSPSVVWISIVTAVGAFSVAALSVYLGYRLFLAGATGQFELSLGSGRLSAKLVSVAPGLGFAAVGFCIAAAALFKLIRQC